MARPKTVIFKEGDLVEFTNPAIEREKGLVVTINKVNKYSFGNQPIYRYFSQRYHNGRKVILPSEIRIFKD